MECTQHRCERFCGVPSCLREAFCGATHVFFSLLFSRSPILQEIRRRTRNQAEEKCGQTPRDLNCWKVEVNSSVLEVNNFKQISANVQDDGPKHIHHGERSRLQLLLAAVAARAKPALTRGTEKIDTPKVIASKSTPKSMQYLKNRLHQKRH